MTQSGPFNADLRRIRRDRAASRWAEACFLQRRIADELLERLSSVQRDFSRALILGYVGEDVAQALEARGIETVTADPGAIFAERAGGVQCDEDRLPFEAQSFDLILATATLDTVNDLPGALILANRALEPDGLLLGGFMGAGSLPRLRAAMLAADLASGGGQPRIHPQIDIRGAGDLLARARFALPVADGERVEARYRSLAALIADLRGAAMTSLIGGGPLSRTGIEIARQAFEAEREDGRITEIFEIVYITGWAPSPDQPQPAARGSGSASLAQVLGRTDKD